MKSNISFKVSINWYQRKNSEAMIFKSFQTKIWNDIDYHDIRK